MMAAGVFSILSRPSMWITVTLGARVYYAVMFNSSVWQ